MNLPLQAAFDCFRTTDWYDDGTIAWEECSVDTISGGDAITGTFRPQEPGLYRFTFTGLLFLPSAPTTNGYVFLMINGQWAAGSGINEFADSVTGLFTISLDIIHELQAGDRVDIRFDPTGGSYLYSYSRKMVHWTGQKL